MRHYKVLAALIVALAALESGRDGSVAAASNEPALQSVGAPAITPPPVAPIPALIKHVFNPNAPVLSEDDIRRNVAAGVVCPQMKVPAGTLKVLSVQLYMTVSQVSDAIIRNSLQTQMHSREPIYFVTVAGKLPSFGPPGLTRPHSEGYIVYGANSGACYKNGNL